MASKKTDKMRLNLRRLREELVSTEESYVKGLDTLTNVYKSPMAERRKKIKVSSDDIKDIFSNLETIVQLHRILLTKFKENPETIIETLHAHAAYFKMYTQFLAGYDKALKTMDVLRKNKNFQSFLLQQQEQGNGSGAVLDMMSYLITPVQRIPRYELLLREILKNTPEEDFAGRDLTEKTYNQIRSIASHINEQKREMENFTKLIKIQNVMRGLQFPLFIPTRHLCKEGGLLIQKNRDKVKERVVYLFNDILLWTNLRNEYKGHMEMKHCKCTSLPNADAANDGDELKFLVTSKEVMITVSCTLLSQKTEWMDIIQELITKQNDGASLQMAPLGAKPRGPSSSFGENSLSEDPEMKETNRKNEEQKAKVPQINIEKANKINAERSSRKANSMPIGTKLHRDDLMKMSKVELVDALLERDAALWALKEKQQENSTAPHSRGSPKKTPASSRLHATAKSFSSRTSPYSARKSTKTTRKSTGSASASASATGKPGRLHSSIPHQRKARGIHRLVASRKNSAVEAVESKSREARTKSVGSARKSPRTHTQPRAHTSAKSPVMAKSTRRKAIDSRAGKALKKKTDYLNTIKIGCSVEYDGQKGTAKFVGLVHFRAGIWVGIQLSSKTGKHNGTVKGKRYFHCKSGFGLLVPAAKVVTKGGFS